MQISTTIRTQPSKNGIAKTDAPKEQQQETEAPKDSFGSAVKREALNEARHFSDRVANVAGGAGGVVGASLGASAALVGGSIVGMAAGGAVGMPISTLFSDGALDFIKTGLSSVGTGAKIGVGLGLVTLAAGGWVLGDKLVGGAAKAVSYPLGLTAGAFKGGARHLGQEAGAIPPEKRIEMPETPDLVSKKSKFMAGTQYAFAGVGGLTGLAGGATIGMAVGAGTEAVASAFKGDFSAAAVTTAGLWGAAIGGAGGTLIGGIGGMKIADMIHGGLNGIAETARISETLLEQDKRGNLMDDLRDRLETNKADFEKEKQAGDKNVENREKSLNARSERLTEMQQTVNDKLTNEDGLTQARSNELYSNETERLKTYEQRLDADKEHLDSEQVRLTGKEGNIDNLIREEATNRREAHRDAEQAKHDTRKGNLESRDRSLQQREANINEIADDRVQSELQPLRDETQRARNSADSNRREASNLRSQAASLEGQVGGILAEASSYESRASSQERENSSLRSEVRSLDSEESRLESDLRECEEEKRHRDDSNWGGGGGHRDDSNWGGGGGHRDSSNWGGSSGHRSSSKWG